MTTTEQQVPTAAERIREAAAALARHRGGPCLVFVSRSLVHADVLTVRTALGSARGDHLDVIVAGPGGRERGRVPPRPGAPAPVRAA